MSDTQEEIAVEPTPVEVSPAVENKKYVGTNIVTNTLDLDDGNIKLILSDGVEYLTKNQLPLVLSETPYTDTDISKRKWNPAIKQIIQILLDNNMQMGDKEWLFQQIDSTIVRNFNEGMAKKFGVVAVDNIALQTIDNILKSN